MAKRDSEKKKPDWDQADVLESKDGVTTNRGLQIWGDGVEGMEGEHGVASEGTAERSGRIASAQKEAAREGGRASDEEDGS